MFEAIFLICIYLLAIVGLSELLHRLWIFLLTPSKAKNKKYLLTFIDDDTAMQQIRAGLEKIRWAGKKEFDGLICIDAGVSEKTANFCRCAQMENDDLILIDLCDATDKLRGVYVDRGEQSEYDGQHLRNR